jgi:hypothetical protein
VKLCKHCGCENSNARNSCVDCGRILGAEISDDSDLSEKLEKLVNRTDDMQPKAQHIAAFWVSLVFLVAFIVEIQLFVLGILILEKPEYGVYLFLGIIALIFSMVYAKFPDILWRFERWDFKMRVGRYMNLSDNEIHVPDSWFMGREIFVFGGMSAGIIIFLYGLTVIYFK